MKWSRWLYVGVWLIGLVAFSFGLAYVLPESWATLSGGLLAEFGWLAYLSVFGVTLLCNLTLIVPVPNSHGNK